LLDLETIQTEFQNYILGKNNFIKNNIVSYSNVSAETRLAIYQKSYFLRLIEVLQKDYLVLSILLGEEKFNQLASDYITAHPSQFRSARWIGYGLADFIKKNYPSSKHYLAEIATFEWLLTASFDQSDQPILSINDMAMIAPNQWANLTFNIHPCVYRAHFYWNILALWHASQHNKKRPFPQKLSTPVEVVIWRKNREVQFISLKPYEAFFLDAIKKGETFGLICEGLCEWFRTEQVSVKAAFLLKRFILDEMIMV